MSSPSTKLAEVIIDRLIAEKIVVPEDHNALVSKLAEGKLQSADWKLAVEKSLDEESRK